MEPLVLTAMFATALGQPLDPDGTRLSPTMRRLTGEFELVNSGLEGERIDSRRVLHADHDIAVAYLVAELEASGLEPWLEPVSAAGRDDLSNIVLDLPAADPSLPLRIVGAHLDTAAGVGANDDASGCAALLELARLLSERELVAPVRLVWFDAHEQGLVGSQTHVDGLVEAGHEVAMMWSLDPVGRDPDGTGDLWVTYDGRWPDPARQLLTVDTALNLHTVDNALLGGDWSSDHAPFREAGFPTLHLASRIHARDHHTAYDEFSDIDIPFIAQVTRLVGEHVLVAAGEVPDPPRDDSAGCACTATRGSASAWWRLLSRRR